MVNRFEDLAPLIAPSGMARGSSVGFRQGVVESWDPLTADNTVRIGGTLFSNLPILASSTEVLLIQPGDVVGIKIVAGTSAFATMYIEGRHTLPGTPQAGSFMDLFGAESASVNGGESTSSGSYTDLTTAGPAVTVDIGQTGRALVVITADITIGSGGVSGVKNGYMSYAISGATIRAATDDEALIVQHALGLGEQLILRMSAASLLAGAQAVNPGSNTFTAKYQSTLPPATFARRNITVVPF